VLLLLPLWHESASGRFALEAAQHAVLRTAVPGVVVAVYADEGQAVVAGASVVQLRNLPLQSRLAESKAELALATGRARSAALRDADFAAATQERDHLTQQTIELESEAVHLSLVSPISGVVVTPRLRDRIGAYAPSGTELAEVADLRTLRVRIYVSEHEIYEFRVGSDARLQVDGISSKRSTRVVGIAPLNSELAPGLEDLGQYQGTRPPNFYVVDLLVPNQDGLLKPGMAGTARLYGRRRSLAGLVAQAVANFFGRKVW
jgi:multidrug resistance efflux pump